jgi:hypothetical protein
MDKLSSENNVDCDKNCKLRLQEKEDGNIIKLEFSVSLNYLSFKWQKNIFQRKLIIGFIKKINDQRT